MAKRTPSTDQLAFPGLETKPCRHCKRTLPLSDFYRRPQAKCKRCVRACNAQWRANNRDAHQALRQRYYRAHPEKWCEYKRQWRRANPSREATLARQRYERNKPARQARARSYAATHQAQRRDALRAWTAANRETVREYGRKRRAAKKLGPCDPIKPELLTAKLAYWGWQCWLCGDEPTAWDHVKPLSKGGAHIPANLRPACTSCNSSKHDHWPFPTHRRH